MDVCVCGDIGERVVSQLIRAGPNPDVISETNVHIDDGFIILIDHATTNCSPCRMAKLIT